MRAAVTGTSLTLSLGFSHPVIVNAPEGISFQVVKNVITVSGIDKQLVGRLPPISASCASLNRIRARGVRYSNEYIRRKAGKTGRPNNHLLWQSLPNIIRTFFAANCATRAAIGADTTMPRLSVFRSLRHIYVQIIDDQRE